MRSPIRWLEHLALQRLHDTEFVPDFIIGRVNEPYVNRWYVIPRNPFFNVYLHQFLRSDQDFALHSHPWLFNISIPIDGRAAEYVPDPVLKWFNMRAACMKPTVRIMRQGQWRFRIGRSFHRIGLFRNVHTGLEEQMWTIFITGPKIPDFIREWGFMCPKGFIPFSRFVKYRHGKGSEPLDGCP